ncbi:MAG: RNA polymerase sigma factor [Bacteroidetes bacterium]|nr:MAG: RNA polymerase sigma factor [Bacteroidota bacterium]
MLKMPIKKILAGCRRGDAQQQQHLFEAFNQSLFVVCLRYARDRPEAQDMLQEAFLAIFRDIHQFSGSGSLEGWLHRVTVRSALQYLRRKNPLRFAEDVDQLPDDIRNFHPDMELNGEAILQLVRQLPDGYRTVFNLRCMDGYSYPEIAAMLDIAESTVRSQYTRACAQLRTQIEKVLITSY